MALHCALSVSFFFFLMLCLYVPEGNLRATLKTSELKKRDGGWVSRPSPRSSTSVKREKNIEIFPCMALHFVLTTCVCQFPLCVYTVNRIPL